MMGDVADLFALVPGQPGAVAALTAAASRPVHAYLLVGPPGTGVPEAALAFAAALLDPVGDPGGDPARRVLAGLHPDVVVVERAGPYITVDTAHEVTRMAARSPVEGGRKVLILQDFHLVREAGPALLKTIEEPPASTVFVVLAEHVPPELVTIASRCVRVDFAPLSPGAVTAALVAEGVDADVATRLVDAAGGRLDRARLLAADPDHEHRQRTWASVPGRLDGTGSTVAAVVDELVAGLDASVVPLRSRQERQLAELEGANTRAVEVNGKVGRGARGGIKAGVKDLEERHKRELRRQRTDELRSGLAVLAGVYRDRLADEDRRGAAIDAIDAIDGLGRELVRNLGETLALQALLCRLVPA